MKKINYKGRCEKRKVSKCKDVCRSYTKIQSAFVDLLEKDDDVFRFTKRCDTSVRYGMIVYTSETRAKTQRPIKIISEI